MSPEQQRRRGKDDVDEEMAEADTANGERPPATEDDPDDDR